MKFLFIGKKKSILESQRFSETHSKNMVKIGVNLVVDVSLADVLVVDDVVDDYIVMIVNSEDFRTDV